MRAIVSVIIVLLCLSILPAVPQSPTITLPEAPAREVVVRVCSNCHAIQRVVDQKRSAEEWDRIVAVMVDRGAQATEAEQAAILEYLTTFFANE